MKIAISGGGIAGLTAAVALHEKGHDVTVFEAAKELRVSGAGISLASNAMRALEKIGLGEQLRTYGRFLDRVMICNPEGEVLVENDSRKISGDYNVINYTIHRADLHAILLRNFPNKKIILGKKAVQTTTHGDKEVLHFSDDTREEADLILACDGIHSPLRLQFVPKSLPRYAGYTCWRGIANYFPGSMDEDAMTETWGARGRVGLVPVSGDRVYWYICLNTKMENDPIYDAWSILHLRKHFLDYHRPIDDVLKNTRPEAILKNDIFDLKPLKRFAFGKVLLMGDAAHAMTPNLGQGACQAIEDAVLLPLYLQRFPDVKEALREFEKVRVPRTARIIRTSRRFGQLAQLQHPLFSNLRNFLVRIAPERMNHRQFRFLFDVDFD
ncbi:MAG TPA: FAD-dependent monooxygenase [Bacteroidia bacterium]|nr:FAD-dependent monooxygenase [Bacteroidia bacterium]